VWGGGGLYKSYFLGPSSLGTRPLLQWWSWRGNSPWRGVWTAPPAARRAPAVTWRTAWSCCATTSRRRAPSTRAAAPPAPGPAPVEPPGARSTSRGRSLASSAWAGTDCPTSGRPATWRELHPGRAKNTTSREAEKRTRNTVYVMQN